MSDWRSDPDVESRLRDRFRSGSLPAAPSGLVDALERVPDASVALRAVSGRHRRRTGRRTTFGVLGVAAILLVGGALALSGGGGTPTFPAPPSTPLAGPRIAYRVAWTAAVPATAGHRALEVDAVQRRIEATGAVGVTVRSEGADIVVVDFSAGFDVNPVRSLIGAQGVIAFIPLGDTQMTQGDRIDSSKFPPLFGGDGIVDASVGSNQTGQRTIDFKLGPTASTLFGDYTAAHIGSFFAIAMDDVVISAPRIMSAIPGGDVEISQAGTIGGWDAAAASRFVAIVRAPLPAPLVEVQVEPGPSVATPSLGPTPTPTDRPSPSPFAGGAPIDCGPDPVDTLPQLTCIAAVHAAVDQLPATRPFIAALSFRHECFDAAHPNAALDCDVADFGIVTVTFIGTTAPVLIGVQFGSTGRLIATILAIPVPEPSGGTFAIPFEQPIDLMCEPGPDRSLTLHIEPAAPRPVWASSDTRARIEVLWAVRSDLGLVGPPPSVVDVVGNEIARDGTVIDVPASGLATIADHSVCVGSDVVGISRNATP
jgi:hypothetical protein